MQINKDQARILSAALDDIKYRWASDEPTKLDATNLINACTELSMKLDNFGDDQRRHGRTSLDDFPDLLRRFVLGWKKRNLNLCDKCVYHPAICEAKKIKSGTGKGNDNVYDCDKFDHRYKNL